jgi:hypothetical protein
MFWALIRGQQGQQPGDLPEFNSALGKFLELPDRPRADFKNVVTEVYPLRADIKKLKGFCDRYLNGTDQDLEPPVVFEPAAPWVLLQVCKYGKLAFRAQNVGWVSQHELAFGFPVRWYERDGQRRFRQWAMVYPFIYVDNPLSMSLGRQVYGWGKAGMELLPPRPDPEPNMSCLVSINLKEGPERGAAKDPDRPRFLEIFQQGSLVSGNAGFAGLYSSFPRATRGYLLTASGLLGMFNNFASGWRQIGTTDDYFAELQNLIAQMFEWSDYADGYLSAASDMALALELMEPIKTGDLAKVRIVTLKQFRDAEDEDTNQACYRAIVMSSIGLSRPTDGGLLRSDPLSPDPSGGIQIKLSELSDGPQIVDSLGIKTEIANGSAYRLRPVSPFWLKADLSYGAADEQYSRARGSSWSKTGGPSPQIFQNPTNLPYILEGSGAKQEIPGPVSRPSFSYRVFALPANEDKLKTLLDNYLRQPLQGAQGARFRFELRTTKPGGPMPEPNRHDYFILMLVSSNEVTGRDKRRTLSDRVVTFALPVTCTDPTYLDPQGRPTERRALVPLYTLVETDWNFVTEYEVYGRFAFKSLIESSAPTWIEHHNPMHSVLSARTLLFPNLEKEEQARMLPFVHIRSSRLWLYAAQRAQLLAPAAASATMNAYLELLGLNPRPDRRIRDVGLKQVRDAVNFGYAGYQALVGVTRKITDLTPIDDDELVDAHIYRYHENTDIVRIMGLCKPGGGDLDKEEVDVDGDDLECIMYKVKVSPGIRIEGKMEKDLGENLCWSIEGGVWNERPIEPQFFTLPE